MAVGIPPKKNTAFTFYVFLVSQADIKLFQVNPTLASGDVKVSVDGAAFANLTTLPVVTPSGGRGVKVDLSADEMNGDTIIVQFVDAAGSEWCDLGIVINTSLQQINDLAATTAFTDALADSTPADGSRPSINQALLLISRFLTEKSLAGTTLTVTKEDGTTAAMTFTLDSATNPTSITRAT